MKLLHVWINDKGCVDKTTRQNSPTTANDQQKTNGLGGWVSFVTLKVLIQHEGMGKWQCVGTRG